MAAGLSHWTQIITFLFLFGCVKSCGVTTHIEIGHRAVQTFHSQSDKVHTNYEQLIRKHPDAFQAGTPYPDAYYSNICFSGKYHGISEDTHWAPFMNATINYIRRHYPPPWDEATEKLVVFLFGFVSHQVADVPWHSLGIDQGFLTTMGKVNFHGSFSTAHPIGDFGGDILTQYELTLPYIGEVKEWYVPTRDLERIYQEFYGQNLIPMDVIVGCTLLLYLSRLGEDLAVAELFPDYANKSPYLVDKLEEYFLGGLDDMAAQTQNVWQEVALMLEHGTSVCSIPRNPLYITCDQTQVGRGWGEDHLRNGFYVQPYLTGVDRSSVQVTQTERGVHLSPSDHYQSLLAERRSKHVKKKVSSANPIDVEAAYSFSDQYSKLGWSMASGDINHDGNSDLLLGSPGWGSAGSIQQGRVYVIFGTSAGLPNNTTAKMISIDGPYKGQSKFGSSLAVVDINRDGILDVAVGAPSFSQDGSHLDYKGMVYIYFGNTAGLMTRPNVTISCSSRYCNWGWTLTAGDLNTDGHSDLLIGSPYAPGGGEQRGFVGGLFSNHKYTSPDVIQLEAEHLDWVMAGDQDYGWFGSRLAVKKSWIAIGQPTFRICALKNCTYSEEDKQSVGRAHLMKASTKGPVLKQTLTGYNEFEQFGSSLSIGQPYDNSTLVLAVSAITSSVEGTLFKFKEVLHQTGKVYLYNLTDLAAEKNNIEDKSAEVPIATFSGNRRYGRFGAVLEFSELTGGGADDLIITSPLYSTDLSGLMTEEAEEGRVFVFKGGPQFPKGNATYGCHGDQEPCPEEQAALFLSFNKQEKKARFGAMVTVVQSQRESSLVISAVHSSYQSVHMQGSVAIYPVKH